MINQGVKALLNNPIAHRGFWSKSVTENTLEAFKNAIDNGFAIETDVFITKDNNVVCSHDNNLFRLTGIDKNLTDLTLSEIKEINLIGGGKIPTLNELLDLNNGRVFLLIEIKNQKNKRVVDKTIEILNSYKGNYAIQSFNPFYLRRVKKLAPFVLRGILSDATPDTKSRLEKWVVKNMPFNFLAKPHFISYNHNALPLSPKKRKNLPLIAWTISDKETHDKIKPFCDNVIFENFFPQK